MTRSIGSIALAAAMVSFGLAGGYSDRSYRREFTLDEEEAQSARRMLNRARARRRQAESERRRAEEAEAARIAAEKEAARPKSRQERRALAREAEKDPRRWDQRDRKNDRYRG